VTQILMIEGTEVAVWEKPLVGDPDAPFYDPMSHLDLIKLHSVLNYLTGTIIQTVNVNHALVAGVSNFQMAGAPESGVAIGINLGQVVVTDHVLVTHNLGYVPAYLVIYEGEAVSGATNVQVLSGGRFRLVSSYADENVVGIRATSKSTNDDLVAVTRSYKVIIFRELEADPAAPLFDVELDAGRITLAKGKINEGQPTVRRTAPGDTATFVLPMTRTIDIQNGSVRTLSVNGNQSLGNGYTGPLDSFSHVQLTCDEPPPFDPDAHRVFDTEGDRFYMESDGIRVFDTDAWPVALLPASEHVTVDDVVVTFPDLVKEVGPYHFQVGGSPLQTGCRSWSAMIPQEWGPQPANHELADQIIATVPAGTDFILAYARVTRTDAPDTLLGTSVPVLPKEGSWVYMPGGALAMEYYIPLVRMMELVLVGTNVVLRRRQSTTNVNFNYFTSGNNPNISGWTYGSESAAHPVWMRQARGPNNDPSGINAQRDEPGACALTDNSDHASTYSVDFRIIPGVTNLTPNGVEPAPPVSARKTDELYSATAINPTGTYSNRNTGPAALDKTVVVVITNSYASASNLREIVSCTLTPSGGSAIAMTRRAEINGPAASGRQGLAAIFTAPVPDNTDLATISYSLNAGGHENTTRIYVFAVYGLQSAVPDAIIEATSGAAANLATVAGGFAVAVFTSSGGNDLWATSVSSLEPMKGIRNVKQSFTDNVVPTDNHIAMNNRIGFQLTDGATLAINPGGFGGTARGHAFVAASFH
jgi:hypothetical protein